MKSKAAEMNKKQTAAIVTTLRNPGSTLDSFINYHLSIGFKHIFLFFDDPSDPAINIAERYSSVTIIRHDAELRRRWEQTRGFQIKDVRDFIDTEVMSRQVLNAEVAVQLAAQKGLDWLLHIDIDELFYSPDQSVSEHFQGLAKHGIHIVRYPNHEAIPETCDIDDPFKSVTLFKKNPRSINKGMLTNEQKLFIRNHSKLTDKFFFYYQNGKSAARVSEALMPNGVHAFEFLDEREWATKLLSKYQNSRRVSLIKRKLPMLTMMVKNLLSSFLKKRSVLSIDASILHYPCCGFEAFWNKYEMLGNFPDKWFGKIDIGEKMGAFILEARNIVMSNDREAAREFYQERVVIENAACINELIERDLCCRITEPSILLAENSTEAQHRPDTREEISMPELAGKRKTQSSPILVRA